MKIPAKAIGIIGLALCLGACAISKPVNVGDTEAQVIAARGNPTSRYRVGNEQILEYNRLPYGQETYLARLGPDGRVISFEQVLTDEKFAAIRINQDTKEDVLHLIGAPDEKTWLPLPRQEVWSYPYRENGVWNSIMHVHFDESGIVRRLEKTPDVRFLDRGNVLGGGPGGGGMR
ncbi:hypothetical protein EDC30_101554 [Paucimonas lemoignei]|uniref:Lipoprotein n=2 Tax=Paucimonas lemoignei TaxID=29443 RepID=A0A4R3I1I6_PAULE|nr:hypothetical protein [Paucimonas lemoignei]TCS39597.1 hypothetical protein EDC30_101554 [Paucimonas lemoignei]